MTLLFQFQYTCCQSEALLDFYSLLIGGGGFPLLFFCCIHVVFTIQPVWTVPGHYWEEKIGGVDYFGKGHEVYLTNVLFWPIALPCMFLCLVTEEYTLGTKEPH